VLVNTVWMRADQPQLLTDTALQACANRVRDHWHAFIDSGINGSVPQHSTFATTTVWQKVTAYKVDTAGKAVAQREAAFSAAIKGSQASALPPQCAIVVTTLTNTPGRRGRGRFFLGGLAASFVTSEGRLTTGKRDQLATAMGQFYTGLRDTPNQGDLLRPVVVSPTAGDSHKITRVQVGDVYDTMRSRRNKLVEQKASFVVDAT
jgi:hypothetical protein